MSNVSGARSLWERFVRMALAAIVWATMALAIAPSGRAQSAPYQRTFPQSKTIVEKYLKELQSSTSGRLPVLEGFIVPGDRPLGRFSRGYYQCDVQLSSAPSGGSLVQVNVKITAWYTDPVSTKSGYQVLPSNGRLEGDFLDRLQDALGSSSTTPVVNSQGTTARAQSSAPAPTVSAPSSGDKTHIVQPKTNGSPFKLSNPLNPANMPSLATQKAMVDRHFEEEAKEARGLEEILHNQAHPNNLVAVKKKDTPVLASPREDSKVLFLAVAEDEFEILDANPNWVHIRISGLSRGWIRRSNLEMLAGESNTQPAEAQPSNTEPAPADTQPFRVENEQVASFPGTWAPLQGKTVRIVSLQKASENAITASPGAKLAFAKSIFEREYADLVKAPTSIVGVVMIFDSEDGGMVAATLPDLRQWKAGSLSDEAFWRRCFFDPREAFGLSATE